MVRSISRSWFVFLLILVGHDVASAQDTVPVTGRIVSATGAPIRGAEIILQASTGAATKVAADAEGRFEFSNVDLGQYIVMATAIGFSGVVHPLSISGRPPSALTLTMPEIVRERVNVVGHSSIAERIPGAAHVIGRDEMERVKLATDDIHQMLRQVPGLNVQEEEGYGLRPNIGIRGTGTDRSSKITLMEDGVLIAPAPYAAPAAYYSPVAGRMESLEVRKGSSQIKYGPITTGGVLNYVSTSIPSDFQLRSSLSGGGDSTRKITASLGDTYRNAGWLVETFQFGTKGFKQLDGGGNTGVDLADYMAKLRFNTTPTQTLYQEIEIKIGHTKQLGDETYLGLAEADFRRAPLRRYAASQVDVLESTHAQYQARHVLARRTWDLTTVAYRNNFHRAWYKLDTVLGAPEHHAERMAVLTGADSAANALTVRNNNRSYYGAGVQSVLGVSASRGRFGHQVEIGVRYHQDEEDRFQQDDGYQMLNSQMLLTRRGAAGSQSNQVARAAAVAGFVADTISWGNWSVSPGIRYESIDLTRTTYARTDPSRTGSADVLATDVHAVIPGVGLSYTAGPPLILFGGIHRGFAPPGPGAAEGTRVEHSVNYEIGTRVLHRGLRTEVALFFNDYGNLLGRDSLATGGSGEGHLFNGGEALVYGLEASALWNVADRIGLQSRLPIRFAYTFTHAEFRNSFRSEFGPWGNVQIGDDLPYLPRHQFYASIETDHRLWRARLETHYVGRMRTVAGQGAYMAVDSTDSYAVLSVSGEYLLRDGAGIFVSIQNLTDNMYIVGRHPAGARPGVPRLIRAGLTLALGRER